MPRYRVFVDYWNFQLRLNELEAATRGVDDYRFKVDWRGLGQWLTQKACVAMGADPPATSFDGVVIYASYNPKTDEGRRFHRWATTWLDRQPGVTVHAFERKPKAPPKCPQCHRAIDLCPHCGKTMWGTVEKGVDTLIATDLIRLAWEDAYDVAVLASSDSDLVPAVDFLNQKGRKIIQAGFPPSGVDLATACWGSFDVFADRAQIARA